MLYAVIHERSKEWNQPFAITGALLTTAVSNPLASALQRRLLTAEKNIAQLSKERNAHKKQNVCFTWGSLLQTNTSG
jgi:hypothetical protein